MLWFLFLLLTIASNIRYFITQRWDIWYLLKAKFNIPLKQRNNKQRSAQIRFWRNCDHVSLKGGKVCYNGKPVLRKSVVLDIVAKALKGTEGSGVRKLYHHLKDVCSGVGERDVRAVLGKSCLHQQLNIRFQTKAALTQLSGKEKCSSMCYLLWMYLASTIGLFHWKEKWSNCSHALNNLQRAWASLCPSAWPEVRIRQCCQLTVQEAWNKSNQSASIPPTITGKNWTGPQII